jgi:hypothetical protein
MKTNRIIIAILLILGIARRGQTQVSIISSDPGPGLRTVMAWPPFTGAAGYQIFRKTSLAAAYPATPVNATPVAALTNCTAIRAILLTPDSTAWKLISRGLADSTALFDPCNLASLLPGSVKYTRLLLMAGQNLAIAQVAGLGFQDATVANGTAYWYKIVAINVGGTQIGVVANDLPVTAGTFTLPPAPTGLVAEAGDNSVQIRWADATGAAGYHIYRSVSPGGFYKRVDETPFAVKVRHHLNGDTLIPAANSMLDFQRWDGLGNPIAHVVNGSSINGPFNGYNWYYKIQSIDLLGRPGPMSASFVSAMPIDKTPPAVPADVSTIPDETTTNGSVEVRWQHVTHDANGHLESPGVVEYRLYRFNTSTGNPDSMPSSLVGGIPVPAPAPGSGTVQMVSTVDNAPNLRAQYGNQTWWYRVRAVDNAGNISRWSAAFSATLKDITNPAIPTGLNATGFEDRIELRWARNTEPDLQGYQIYRSYCDYGKWVPCPDALPPTDPNCPPCKKGDTGATGASGQPTSCSGPFVFLGELTKDSMERALLLGHPVFADRTIPAGSPVCYAYWIKAVDKSGNRSGDYPYPNAAEQTQIVCERLRDKTPPDPALISALFARDKAIRVEWIAPPTQDTRAFHVYRAEETKPQTEPVPGSFIWVGGMTVERPPQTPQVLTQPYKPVSLSTCDVIPVEGTETMSKGYFVDTKVEEHKIYWYKVVGIDFDGNEGPLKKAVSVSSFTFQTQSGAAPIIETIVQQPDTCGIRLQWLPAFDANLHNGFILYKSLDAGGPFVQVSTLLTANTFLDKQVVHGRSYWYKLAIIRRDGKMSEINTSGAVTPGP